MTRSIPTTPVPMQTAFRPARFGAYNPAAGMSQIPTELERDLVEAAKVLTGGSLTFAQSLLDQLRRRGSLSDKQAQCARDLCKRTLKPAVTAHVVVSTEREKVALGDFSGMIALFDQAAKAKSEKAFKPKVRLVCGDAKIELTVASAAASQPGTINVTDGGGFDASTWYGRILRTGDFEVSPRQKPPAGLIDALNAFAQNPLASMVAYGRRFGKCSICARTLKDPVSIERGIGPICADKFGF